MDARGSSAWAPRALAQAAARTPIGSIGSSNSDHAPARSGKARYEIDRWTGEITCRRGTPGGRQPGVVSNRRSSRPAGEWQCQHSKKNTSTRSLTSPGRMRGRMRDDRGRHLCAIEPGHGVVDDIPRTLEIALCALNWWIIFALREGLGSIYIRMALRISNGARRYPLLIDPLGRVDLIDYDVCVARLVSRVRQACHCDGWTSAACTTRAASCSSRR